MYSIVEISGKQFKVEKDQEIFVNRLEGSAGDKVSFDKVLMTGDEKKVNMGGGAVSATIVEHFQADKVIVFKKKRRKGYRKKNGHRQAMTKIKINSI